MTLKCTPKNTYFWHPCSPIEEHHQYVFVGSSDDQYNIPIAEKTFVAIRGKVVNYNKEAHKNGLKVLLASDPLSFAPKKREWSTTLRWGDTAICSVMIAVLCYGACQQTQQQENHTCNVDFDQRRLDNKNVADLVFISCMSAYLFCALAALQILPFYPSQSASCYLRHRYWKVMKLENKPSSAERLFRTAIQHITTPSNSPLSNITLHFSRSSLQHPTLNRAMTNLERDTFLEFLMNGSEDNKPIDPYDLQPIASEDLWTSKTIIVNRGVHNLKQLLKFIFINCQQRDENIVHPVEQRFMNPDEKETFFKDLATIFCVDKEMIRNCWKKNPRALRCWALEVLKSHYSHWNTFSASEQADLMKNVCGMLGPLLPIKLFNDLPTYKDLVDIVGAKLVVKCHSNNN